MKPDSSGSLIERIIAWLRGFLAAGKSATHTATRDVRQSAREATDTAREGVDVAERKVRDVADRRDTGAASATDRRDTGGGSDRDRQGLPDLADEPSGGGTSSFGGAATTSPRDAAATYGTDTAHGGALSDDEVDQRSDFDDAAGDWETGEETYPPAGTDIEAATHVHDAIGGEDALADDSTDGSIDTTRDADLRPGGTEGYQDREVPLQDEIIVDEGASSEEFDGDEVTPGDADNPYVSPEDVESAAEGYGDTDNTSLAATSAEGTSTLTGSTFTQTDVDVPAAGEGEGEAGGQQAQGGQDDAAGDDFHVVERYNYGMGDLGVGAGTAPDDAWADDAGQETSTADLESGTPTADAASQQGGDSGAEQTAPDVADDRGTEAPDQATEGTLDATGSGAGIDASVSPDATRTEIESQSRGDAVNRSDEATQTPGFGEPETFDSAAAGTTEPSRSATGNELDDDQDALGTTLDFEAESDAFDEDAANLSGEEELAVSDENVGSDAERAGGVERVTTFQSGTIAHEGFVSEEAGIDEEVTAEAYADLPDEPQHETADDAGVDDFSGSDYPSDRRVDTLAGDDFTDAEEPDVLDLDSSAGDLDVGSTAASAQDDVMDAPVGGTVGDAGQSLDQDLVGTSDEHVGGEEPEFAEMASRGTDETGFDDLSAEAQAVDEAMAGEPSADGGAAGTYAAEGSFGGEAATDAGFIDEAPAEPASGEGDLEIAEPLVAEDRSAGSFETGDASGAASDTFATDDITGSGDLGAGAAGMTETGTEPEVGGMGISDAAADEGADQAAVAGASRQPSRAGGKPVPAGAVRGDGGTEAPAGYPVKGNANSMIYHLPGFPSYSETKAEFYFANEQDAIAAGYRAPGNVRRDQIADIDSGSGTGVTGEETSHVAPGEVAFDERLSDTEDAGMDAAAGTSSTEGDVASGDGEPDDDIPAGAIRGDGTTDTPEGYPVKGNASSKIYHLPNFPSYKSTKAEFCFATEQDAINAGYRAPGKRNRGRRS